MDLDPELIVRAQRGDTMAQEQLVRELAPVVFRRASRFFRIREDIEDVAQEAFARFFKNIQQLPPAENVGGWVSRVTINVCYDRFQPKKPSAVATWDRTFTSVSLLYYPHCLLFPEQRPSQCRRRDQRRDYDHDH